MDFSFSSISLANLFGNGNNYLSFSIMGMLIVFCGLSIISIYIMLLPKILNLPSLLQKKESSRDESAAEESLALQDQELLLAITVALHLDQTRNGRDDRITWARYTEHESAWLTAGRMRGLAVRSHLPDRKH